MHISKKKLLFVTGTRADYGKLEPLAKEAQKAGFLISFFITGMHMLKKYGETRCEVKQFPGAEFFEFVNQREGDELDFILSKTILGFSDFVHEHRPDMVIIHGDRIEALAASIVCALRYILSAHIEGGEVSGTIDESLRHCNSKLCAIHFVSSIEAKKRVMALGESADRIYKIGSPELDTHLSPSGVTINEVRKYYEIPFEEYGIVIFHPVTSETDTIAAQAESLFMTLKTSGKNFVVIAPNNDPGTIDIAKVIEELPSDKFRVIPSMRFRYFSELMKNASIMIGNSSAGVREIPFLGKPSIDIGTRQKDRALSPTVYKCSPFDRDMILSLIHELWGKKFDKDVSFGQGCSANKFVNCLKNESIWDISLQKRFDHP